MADLCDEAIVVFGRDHLRYSADRLRNFAHTLEGAVRCRSCATEKVWCILEQIGVCGVRAGMFHASHRVPADEPDAEPLRFVADRHLGAADIRYESRFCC